MTTGSSDIIKITNDPQLPRLAQDDLLTLQDAERAAEELGFFAQIVGPGIDQIQGLGFRFLDFLGELTGIEELETVGEEGAIRNFNDVARAGGHMMITDVQTVDDFMRRQHQMRS